MINNLSKKKVSKIIEKASKKKLIKSYSQFCETNLADKTALSEDEINYYTSQNKRDDK